MGVGRQVGVNLGGNEVGRKLAEKGKYDPNTVFKILKQLIKYPIKNTLRVLNLPPLKL